MCWEGNVVALPEFFTQIWDTSLKGRKPSCLRYQDSSVLPHSSTGFRGTERTRRTCFCTCTCPNVEFSTNTAFNPILFSCFLFFLSSQFAPVVVSFSKPCNQILTIMIRIHQAANVQMTRLGLSCRCCVFGYWSCSNENVCCCHNVTSFEPLTPSFHGSDGNREVENSVFAAVATPPSSADRKSTRLNSSHL